MVGTVFGMVQEFGSGINMLQHYVLRDAKLGLGVPGKLNGDGARDRGCNHGRVNGRPIYLAERYE